MSGSIIEFFDNYWFGIGVFLLAIFVSLHEARIKGESGLQFLVRLPGNLIACFFVSIGGYVILLVLDIVLLFPFGILTLGLGYLPLPQFVFWMGISATLCLGIIESGKKKTKKK